uniref:Zgc:136892 n=1 Tax=Cyprinus carpio TaxID=7962 RepID=A0A8C2F9K1_CYPCA
MHMLASVLALLGWVRALLSCLMPMWRVTAFIGTTTVTSEIMWEGIWMRPYKSMLTLGPDLQAARSLTVMPILLGAVGLVLSLQWRKVHHLNGPIQKIQNQDRHSSWHHTDCRRSSLPDPRLLVCWHCGESVLQPTDGRLAVKGDRQCNLCRLGCIHHPHFGWRNALHHHLQRQNRRRQRSFSEVSDCALFTGRVQQGRFPEDAARLCEVATELRSICEVPVESESTF